MKKLNEQLDRMHQLMELDIVKKQRIGRGSYHTTYPMQTDPDKVVKTGGGEWNGTLNVDKEHAEIFLKAPNLFPIIYRHGKTFIVMERLDTRRVKQESKLVSDEISYAENGRIAYESLDYIWKLAMQEKYDGDKYLQRFLNQLDDPESLSGKYARFFQQVADVFMEEDINPKHLDVHEGQFGYDKNGNLKMLDF